MNRRERKAAFTGLNLATLGTMFPACIIVGLAIGYGLDKVFGTKPWLMMVFLLLGIVAAFYQVAKSVSRMESRWKKGP